MSEQDRIAFEKWYKEKYYKYDLYPKYAQFRKEMEEAWQAATAERDKLIMQLQAQNSELSASINILREALSGYEYTLQGFSTELWSKQLLAKVRADLASTPAQEQSKADFDVMSYGQSFMKDGKHIPLSEIEQPAQEPGVWSKTESSVSESQMQHRADRANQNPIAYMYKDQPNSVLILYPPEEIPKSALALYTHPAPSWQGLSANAIAVEQLNRLIGKYDELKAHNNALCEALEEIVGGMLTKAINNETIKNTTLEMFAKEIKQALESTNKPIINHYHPCTSILIDALRDMEGGDKVLKEWDKQRSIIDGAKRE